MDKKTRSDLEKLNEKRRRIDLLDQKLLMFLNQRLQVVLEIGKIKKRIGKKTYDPGRETEVLEGLTRKNKGPLKEEDLRKIFATIMKTSRKSQI